MEQTQQAMLIIQNTGYAAMTQTAMPTATVNTPTPRATVTPLPTSTPPFTPTVIKTPTATPLPVAVLNANANLRSGPGVVYAVIVSLTSGTKVTVLEKDPDSTWFRVKVDSTGQTGWVSISVVNYNFDIASIAIAEVIPPTPTYAPVGPANTPTTVPGQPTNTPTSVSQSHDNDAHVFVTNYIPGPLTIEIHRPSPFYDKAFVIKSGDTLEIDLPSGTYFYYASAAGYYSGTGTYTFPAGNSSWTWGAD